MYKDDFHALAAKLGYEDDMVTTISRTVPSYYHPFHLIVAKKEKIKIRHIDSPGKKSSLRALQKAINKKLLSPEINCLPASMVGSVKKKDLFAHLIPHIGQPTVVCMDLENCFPNISHKRLFNVWRDDLGYADDLAKILNRLTTYRGYLPQGPPTSPLLCNFALSKMAAEITALCEANNLTYTQYVDDICISGDDNVVRAVIGEVYKIANAHGQKINTKKTEIMDRKHQQRSAGVILNNEPKLLKDYGNSIVGEIRTFEATGLVSSGEKLHIMGKILYLQRFSKKDAERIKEIFNIALLSCMEVDQNLPKSGNVKRCFHHVKNRYNDSRCKYL